MALKKTAYISIIPGNKYKKNYTTSFKKYRSFTACNVLTSYTFFSNLKRNVSLIHQFTGSKIKKKLMETIHTKYRYRATNITNNKTTVKFHEHSTVNRHDLLLNC